MGRHLAFLLALFPPATAAAQVELPRTHRPGPTAPAITPGDLMTRLYILGGEVGDSAARITAEQASGKLVVLRVPGGVLGLRALRNPPSVPGAAAVALVALDSLPPQAVAFLRRPRTVLDDNPAGPAARAPA